MLRIGEPIGRDRNNFGSNGRYQIAPDAWPVAVGSQRLFKREMKAVVMIV